MGNLSNYYAKTGKKNPFATTSSDTSGGTSQSGGFLRQYQEKNNLDTPFEVVKTKPITPVKVVQAPKPVDNIQSRVATNASWVGGQVNQNVLQPIANTVKKIGNFTAKLVNPQSTMLKDAGIDTAKMETLKLKPDQKKLAPEQLQKVGGASASMKPQSKEESLKKAREIQAITAKKIQDLEKAFQAKKVEPKKLPKGYKEPGILRDQVDSILLGTTSVLGNIGAGIEMEGRKAVANPYDIKSIAGKFFATQIGKRLKDESDNIIASNPEWAEDPNEKLMKDGKPNPRKIARLATGAAPSILVNIAATLITAPVGGWGGLATGYLMEGGATYKEAKEMGVSEEKAQFYGTTVGIVNSIFEHLMPGSATGVRKLFKSATKEVGKEAIEEVSKSFGKEALRQAKKYGINILKNGTIEGTTEAIQEFWSNVIATNYDKNRKVWDNMIESAIGGFLGGGVAGGSTESAVDNNIIVIPEGEHTPQAVIGQVISNGQENTVEGKELLKTAVEAQQKGQNVLIETTKEGEVNSEVKTINQEETKAEAGEYKSGSITELQNEMDKILGVDHIKAFGLKKRTWGQNYQITQQAADAGDVQAIADIDKLVELQGKIEDLRDQRQKTLKTKKTKKSAKDYVESKVKERSVKFRTSKAEQANIDTESDILQSLLDKEEITNRLFHDNKSVDPIEDQADMDYIVSKIQRGKATMEDINAGFAILEKNGYGPELIRTIRTADAYAKSKKGPKFREDPNQTQTLDELLAIKTPNLEQLKLINKMRAEQMAKSKEKSAENIAEEQMGWKDNQKDEFDAAMSRKDAAKVREMLPGVPEYFKAEFKQEIDEVLNNDLTEETKILRGTKGMTAEDIMKTYPNIQLKKDVPATDIYGNKKIIPEGEKLTPYELKGNKILLQDGETYIVTKNQFQNIKNQSKTSDGKPFAPELEGLEETVKGASKWQGDELIDNGSVVANVVKNEDGTWSYQSDMSEGSDTFKTRKEAMDYAEADTIGTYSQGETKYSQYTLPGGNNYREILIKAPRNLSDARDITSPSGRVIEGVPSGRLDFKSSHWGDELNVIAHLRMNEREYNGQKVAFMEELQSDWAREGRSKGFIDDSNIEQSKKDLQAFSKQLQEKYNQGEEGLLLKTTREETARWIELNNATRPDNGVPNNPLLKNWQELTIKRALKEAVNSDAEYFAWINGNQTSNRYNLATHVKDVVWYLADGYKIIKLQPKEMADRIEFGIDAEGVIRQVEEARYVDWKGKKLDEVLGKGLADKIMADEKGTLSGEGLRFGGEWADTLYDKQVKNIVEDLTGGKVEEIDMGLPVDKAKDEFRFADINQKNFGENLDIGGLKVGLEIEKGRQAPYTRYIVTEVSSDGKFSAIKTLRMGNDGVLGNNEKPSDYVDLDSFKKRLIEKNGTEEMDWIEKRVNGRKEYIKDNSETFNLSQETTQQQALKLTPEIKARIKGEALQIKTSGKMFEDAKFRVKDDVKRMTGRTITDAQEQELIDLNKKIFGDENVNITLQIMANSKALGKYEQNMIDILDGQADPKATYLHEAVHKYLDVFSTTDEYTQVLEEGATKYKTEDFAEVEEKIAEDFIAYAKNKESAPKTITGKIKSFFDSVLERIKIYFGNKSAIDRLYNDIVEGKAAKKATKTAKEAAPAIKTDIPTNEIAQTPAGEGDKTKSKAYTRVYDRLAEEAQQDVSYNKLNLEKDTQNALEFIATDPKAAIRVGLGLEEAPTGQTETAISIALADKAGRDGDFALQSQLEASRSLRQTRRGQEIVSERGRFNEDSPHFFIRELMDMRLKNLGSNLKSSLEELQGKAKSVKKAALEKIDKGVSKLKEKIKADRKKIALAQDIIDSIIC